MRNGILIMLLLFIIVNCINRKTPHSNTGVTTPTAANTGMTVPKRFLILSGSYCMHRCNENIPMDKECGCTENATLIICNRTISCMVLSERHVHSNTLASTTYVPIACHTPIFVCIVKLHNGTMIVRAVVITIEQQQADFFRRSLSRDHRRKKPRAIDRESNPSIYTTPLRLQASNFHL